jgi:1-acyl-sn-glycerol-3-phosphate acyltransferase
MATNVPCLPIALVGASTAMPRGVNWPKRGRYPVAVVFGEPMSSADGETAEAFSTRLADAIRRLHESVSPLPEPATKERTQHDRR